MKLILVVLLFSAVFLLLTACSVAQDESSTQELTVHALSPTRHTKKSIVASRQDRNVPNLQRFLEEAEEGYYVVRDNNEKEFFRSEKLWRGYEAIYCSENIFYIQVNRGGSSWGYRFFDVERRLVSQEFQQDYDSLAAGYGLVVYVDNWKFIVQDIFEPKKFKKSYVREIYDTVIEAISKPVFLDAKHLLLEYEVKPKNGETYRIIGQEVIGLTKPVDTPPVYRESYVPIAARDTNVGVLATNYTISNNHGQVYVKVFDYSGKEIHHASIVPSQIYHIAPDVLSIDDEEFVNLKTGKVTTEKPKLF